MSEQPPNRESELIEFVRAIDIPAPDALRRSTERLIAERRIGVPGLSARRGVGVAPAPWAARGGAAVALLGAVVAVALVVALGSSSQAPARSLPTEVATLALRGPTHAAPAESPRRRDQLVASVEGLAFPYWGGRFGWRSSGSRADRVGGRSVSTVFYTDAAGQRVGYAILAGAAPAVSGGLIVHRGGRPYRVLAERGGRTVLWTRGGHLCVVAGRGVSSSTLLRLASWDARGASA